MNSSVLCELLLCAASVWAAADSLKNGHGWRVAGFAMITFTALLGALVYGGLEMARPAHQTMTGISGRISLLLIAVGSLHGATRHLLLAALAALMLWLPNNLALAGNLLALIAIAWPGRSQRWPLAIAGALLFVLAGLGIAERGDWWGIPRVDLYHLTLMLATLCWTLARLRGTRWLLGTPASLAR
ncbi:MULTISPECIES: hypothetical protein [Pseudomonas]|uniref:hypothetical protein n=1 Tax=Pseudomonas nitroreducens TaxID=46680 RepID=UPI001E42D4BB|nr:MULTISPECIES: hypothetical protein [Pseudomonas]MCE4070512.1 hypothetical protein [Pseudomonas nitritireducens]MCE4080618.1 hypothetical protein [Pseudomonas nitroreducens]